MSHAASKLDKMLTRAIIIDNLKQEPTGSSCFLLNIPASLVLSFREKYAIRRPETHCRYGRQTPAKKKLNKRCRYLTKRQRYGRQRHRRRNRRSRVPQSRRPKAGAETLDPTLTAKGSILQSISRVLPDTAGSRAALKLKLILMRGVVADSLKMSSSGSFLLNTRSSRNFSSRIQKFSASKGARRQTARQSLKNRRRYNTKRRRYRGKRRR